MKKNFFLKVIFFVKKNNIVKRKKNLLDKKKKTNKDKSVYKYFILFSFSNKIIKLTEIKNIIASAFEEF